MKQRSGPAGRPRFQRVIQSEADIAEGAEALAARCPFMASALRVVGRPPLRRWNDGFAGLARVIVGQQLSTASANAIHGRLIAAIDPMEAAELLSADDAALRACGLSVGKVATLRAAAKAVETGALDFGALHTLESGEAHAALTAIKGIGPWTADIYLMFCRGDADAFAPGDLALQIGVQMLAGHERRPSAAEIGIICERWRPWRAVAARLIWAYYGAVKAGAVDLVQAAPAEAVPPSIRPPAEVTYGGPRKTRAEAPPRPPPTGRRRLQARGGRSGE